MSLKQIAQNKPLLENLFGTAATMGANFINEQDWFDNDNLLEKIPYGKIVGWLVKKAVEIENVDEAFTHAYAMAYFLCFSQAVKRYKIFLGGTDLVEIKEDRQTESLFKLIQNTELIDTEIYEHYSEKYRNLLTACDITEKTQDTVFNYINRNLKIVFHELLEEKPVTYKTLCDELDKKSFSLRNEKLQITKYYTEQKNLFLTPVMGDEQGMTLKEVYTAPGYRIHRNCIEKDEISKYFYESRFIDPERNFVDSFVESKKQIYDSIHGLLNDFVSDRQIRDKIKHPATGTLVLLGYPGQGKTSCIRKLLDDLIEDIENPPLLYHLPLRTIENVTDFCNAPFELIAEHIKRKNLPDSYAKKLVKEGIIILEGLDELAIQSGTKEKTIDEVVTELLRIQENRASVKLIITSRLGYLDCKRFMKKNLLIVQLKEFSTGQQVAWLEKYKYFYPQCKIEAKDIDTFNEDHHHLKELINQPILLHMIVTAEIEITDNTNRAKLYEALFNSLIEREWADNKKNDRQIEILKGLNSEDLRDIIRDIALAVFHRGRNCIQKKEIEKLDAVKRHLIDNLGFDKLGGALKGVMVSFYFRETEQKEETGAFDYGIEFLHKSLGEYMAAEKIWNEIKTFLEQRPSNKGYYIDTLEDALRMLNLLFAPQLLTTEVRDYIREIMGNDADCDMARLSNRLIHFLPGLLQKEFLWYYDAEKFDFPVKQALHTFYGYWTVLSKLADILHKNVLQQEDLPGFIQLLQFCLILPPPPVFLQYQNLQGINLQMANLSGANLFKVDLSWANLEAAILEAAILSRANLEAAILSEANLFKVDLSWANLEEANLRGTILSEADLFKANLFKVDLSWANLREANLREANLEGANLEAANLEAANLEAANLEAANLEGANLEGANFEGANLEVANLTEADLSEAILKNCSIDQKNYDFLKAAGIDVSGMKII